MEKTEENLVFGLIQTFMYLILSPNWPCMAKDDGSPDFPAPISHLLGLSPSSYFHLSCDGIDNMPGLENSLGLQNSPSLKELILLDFFQCF